MIEYKKYVAPTLKEAKIKMLLDIGHNAVIVGTKMIKTGGFLGVIGSKPMVELTAMAVEKKFDKQPEKHIEKPKSINKKIEKERSNDNINTENISRLTDSNSEIQKTKINSNSTDNNKNETITHIADKIKESLNSKKEEIANKNDNSSEIRDELNQMKSVINTLIDKFDNFENININRNNIVNNTRQTTNSSNTIEDNETKNTDDIDKYPSEIINQNSFQPDNEKKEENFIKNILINQDFDDTFIEKFMQTVNLSNIQICPDNQEEQLRNIMENSLEKFVNIKNDQDIEDNLKNNIIVLVGPTGVGKTTTIAKLGANFAFKQNKKVKLISIDTFRVGALQQLKLYADIMDFPFAKINTPTELELELTKKDSDIILIDTAGRNQKSSDDLIEINKYLDVIPKNKRNISLVVSATTKYRDIIDILERFSIFNYNNLIITKLDETNSIGPVISALGSKHASISYLSFGQSVPEDFSKAKSYDIVDLLIKSDKN